MSGIETSNHEYRDKAGRRFVGYLVRPAKPTGAALLISHAGIGVTDHERPIARKLGELGYIVLVGDYWGDGTNLTGAELMPRIEPFLAEPTKIRGEMQAAFDALLVQPGVDPDRVAAIGYCFGGTAVIELACTGVNLQTTVAIHAGLPTTRPDDYKNIRGRILVLNGSADPLVTAESRTIFENGMNAAGIDWQMHLYGGGVVHAFTMVGSEKAGYPGIAYHKLTDERSWRLLLDMLDETVAHA